MHQSNCKWITFDIETGLCELFEDCPSTDVGDCYSCVSSEVTCETACYIQGNCQVLYLFLMKKSNPYAYSNHTFLIRETLLTFTTMCNL